MSNNERQQAMWVSTGDPETVNDSRNPQPGQLGRYMTVKQPTSAPPGVESGRDKTYRSVQVDSSSPAPYAGATAWWSDKAAFKATVKATNRNSVAGVFLTAVTPGNYCFIGTGGPHTVKFIDAPTSAPNAAGKCVIPSATDGKADCLAVGTAPTHRVMGWVANTPTYDASGSTAVVELDITDNP